MPVRNIIGQRNRGFSTQEVLDNKKILICNFSKGEIGEDASALLGSMILSSIQSVALFRALYDQHKRIPFYLYIDEIHSFITLAFADILAESRKYGLGLFITHQYVAQLHEKIRAAIFGNVGTLISFRVGATDAEYLAKEFPPVFNEDDLINLPQYSMYLKLMIDGATSKPFSAFTLALAKTTKRSKEKTVRQSQTIYGMKREEVEKMIFNKYQTVNPVQSTLFT